MTAEQGAEFRGKTVEAAVIAGLAALRLGREQVEIEVVRPGSRGVLGIGAEDAVVRLHPVAAVQAPARPEPVAVRAPAPAAEPVAPRRQETPPAQPAQPVAAADGDERDRASAEQGRQALSGLLSRMGVQAEVQLVLQTQAETDEDGPDWVLNITGDDLGTLIGRQNETLTALEFITRLMVNQQTHARSSFSVDVNGYRAKRAEALRRLALKMAEQAVQTGRTMTLEPMSPAERRLVHLALREDPAVTTQSVGEEGHRKVTIVPKRA
jgi:spoIIIJ-associated protein